MTTITEGALTFSFPAGCQASKYDDWSFYSNQFQPVANGCKAIDILCVEGNVSWLIEVKDYRWHPRTKAIDIAGELATKVRDTLAGWHRRQKGPMKRTNANMPTSPWQNANGELWFT